MGKITRFIAFLDILGFKELIENNDIHYVEKLYDKFEPSLLYSLALTNFRWRVNNLSNPGLPDLDKIPLNSLTISDSIIIWTDDSTAYSFVQLLNTVKYHLGLSFQYGVPLRGGITFGEFVVKSGSHNKSKKQNEFITILGKPLTKAYLLENQAEWAGCIVDDSCIEFYDNLESNADSEFLQQINLLKRYKVPFKNGEIKDYYTINLTNFGNRLDRSLVRKAFSEHNKRVNNWSVENKIRNTEKYWDDTEIDFVNLGKFLEDEIKAKQHKQ